MRHRHARSSTGGDAAIVEALQHDYVRGATSLRRVRDLAVDDPAPVHSHVYPAIDPRVAHERGCGCRAPVVVPVVTDTDHLAPFVSERKIPWMPLYVPQTKMDGYALAVLGAPTATVVTLVSLAALPVAL